MLKPLTYYSDIPFVRNVQPFSLTSSPEGLLEVPLLSSPGESIGKFDPLSIDVLTRLPEKSMLTIEVVSSTYEKDFLEKYLAQIERVSRIIRKAKEAALRGASFLKLKINGEIFDVWIEELD